MLGLNNKQIISEVLFAILVPKLVMSWLTGPGTRWTGYWALYNGITVWVLASLDCCVIVH